VRYTLGLDLGQASDYTALVIVESSLETEPKLAIRHIQRLALGTSYPKIAECVAALLRREELAVGCDLVVDSTGVGRPVMDLLRRCGLRPVAVTITGGDAVTHNDTDGFRVPKRDLVMILQVLLQEGRLKCANLPGAEVLQAELSNFRVTINPTTGHDSYGAGPASAWREGEHDDLVLAAALACWYVETHPVRVFAFASSGRSRWPSGPPMF
jgi:hypothetical protein